MFPKREKGGKFLFFFMWENVLPCFFGARVTSFINEKYTDITNTDSHGNTTQHVYYSGNHIDHTTVFFALQESVDKVHTQPMVNTFEQSNLQNTDLISLKSRIISLEKIISLYEDNVEYKHLLSLYKTYISLNYDSERLVSAFDKKLRKISRSFNSKLSVQESPIITIGTILRILSVDEHLESIMNQYDHGDIQIISLGSGSDLRFQLDRYKNIHAIVEIDFKDALLLKQSSLQKPAHNVKFIGMDLSNTKECIDALRTAIDPSKHVVISMECLLCYLPISISSEYFSFFKDHIPINKLHYLVYDPITTSESDPFSDVMFDNLKKHNFLNLFALKEFKSIDEYVGRFGIGDRVKYKNLWQYLKDRPDMNQLCKLCQIDEFEELEILLSHYLIAYS